MNEHIAARKRAEDEINDIKNAVRQLRDALQTCNRPEEFRTCMVSLKEHLMSLVRANRRGSG
jgi:hypothetical protein